MGPLYADTVGGHRCFSYPVSYTHLDVYKRQCQYCPYKGACGFDEKTAGYRYRRLNALKPEEIWDKMRDGEKSERLVDKEV